MRAPERALDERGVTIMDILVSMILMAIGAGGIFAGFKSGLTVWTTSQQFAGEQHNARTALDWTTRRLRMTGSGYAGSVPALAVAAANEVAFYANADGDPAVECYRIYLNAGVVYGNETELPTDCSTGSGQPISANVEAKGLTVTSLAFEYFSGDTGAGIALTALPLSELDRGRVRRIQVTIGVSGQTAAGPLSMSTQVFIR